MQLNFNGVSSRILTITGLLVFLLAAVTNHWRKKTLQGKVVSEGIWQDCAKLKSGEKCYLTLREIDRLSGVQALVLLAAVFDFSNLLISGFIYCLKTALKPFLIIIETFSVIFAVTAIILYLHYFIVEAKWSVDWSLILAAVGATLITVGDIQGIVHFSRTKKAKAMEKLKKYLPMESAPVTAESVA